MELRHLRYFVAVAETLNFRRAAERLHISQPPLSLQIRQLETEIGVELFQRSNGGTLLTQAGRIFHRHARDILAAVDAGVKETRLAAGAEIGTLNVGWTSSSDFVPFLPLTIREFGQRHPRVVVNLIEMPSFDQTRALLEGRLDIGVARPPEKVLGGGLRVTEVWRDHLMVAVPADAQFAACAGLHFEELREENFIAPISDSGMGINFVMREMCRRRGFTVRVVQECSGHSMTLGLVAAGMGIAVVPSVLASLQFFGIRFVPLRDDDAYCSLVAITLDQEGDPLRDNFLAALRQVADATHDPALLMKGGAPLRPDA